MKTTFTLTILVLALAAFMKLPPLDPASRARDATSHLAASISDAEPVKDAGKSRAKLSSHWLSRATPGEWSPEQVEKIRRALNSTNEKSQENVFTTLFPSLVARDVAAAVRLVETLEPGPVREELLRQLALGWARSDRASALEWASNLKNMDERVHTLTTVCLGIAESNPPAAIEAAERFGVGSSFGTIEILAQLWAASDLRATLEWANQQPVDEQRDQLLARVAFVQAATEPMQAANLIVEKIRPGSIQNEAIISVLHQWALRDQAEARAWVQRFPAGALRERGESELAGLARYQKLPSATD